MDRDELARELEALVDEAVRASDNLEYEAEENAYEELAALVANNLPAILSALQTESAPGGGELLMQDGLLGILEALACDCENTDGWEDAAPTIREAAAHIRALEAENKRLDYNSIHSCNDRCDRLPCVQRREIERLEAENAMLKERTRDGQ